MTEEETREIMTKILEHLKPVATHMIRAAEGIKQQLAQQGKEMEDRKLMQTFILSHFESGFKDLQDKILAEFDVDESELEDACNTYVKNGDKKLREICERIRMIYKEFGGEIDSEDKENNDFNEEIPLETIVAMLKSIGGKMSDETESFVQDFKAEYGVPDSRSDIEIFQGKLMELSERYNFCKIVKSCCYYFKIGLFCFSRVESEVVESFSVSQINFQKCLQKHASNSMIQHLIQNLQVLITYYD